jgi:hypothetical protein
MLLKAQKQRSQMPATQQELMIWSLGYVHANPKSQQTGQEQPRQLPTGYAT